MEAEAMLTLRLDETETTAFPGFCEDKGSYLAHEDVFLRKYRHWRGRSGRSYVFSAYAPDACPAYEDAVVIVAARRGTLACVDLGPLPETTLAGLQRRYATQADVEFQIHVLTDRGADRRALIADLSPDA
jgi:hypothetical protein